ncbi:MAG: glycosyltransferase family 4 protein [Erysipelotrichaceae bacterium]|nr:glycosyltransferase family 4 protein [Erysipelotrichaceae bacterium]
MSEKKPKILYIVRRLSGGIFTYLVELSNRLVDLYDITIGYATNEETPENIRSHFDKRISLVPIVSFQGKSNLINDASARTELRALAEAEKPDIIHFHGYEAGRLGRKTFADADIPMFYTPHGYLFLSEDHNVLSRSLFRMNEQSCARTNCTTVAVSKGEYAETLAFTDNAVYINNGVNLVEIDHSIKDEVNTEHPLTVFTTGLINPQKNPDLFNEIADAMPDVRFVWIGDGEMRYKLKSRNIEVTGWLEREDALKRAYQADVFILTSLWEGLPLSLLEAMYLKKLCIVNNVIGSRDVIHNGENGYLCNSAASFVNAITHVNDPQTREIVENAQQDVIRYYNLDKMAISYIRLYQKALDQK